MPDMERESGSPRGGDPAAPNETALSALPRESELLLRLSLQAAGCGTYAYDFLSGQRHWSAEFKRLYGLRPEDPLALGPDMAPLALHPEDRLRFVAAMRDSVALDGDGKLHLEFRIIHSDGTIRWLRVQGHTEFTGQDGERRPLRAAGLVWDITEHMQAQEARQRSEERYSLLFESMLNGFALHEIVCDASGRPVDYRFLEANPAFERLTGLKAGQIIGKTVREVLPEIEEGWIETYGRVALTGEPAAFESHAAALDRWYRILAYRATPGQFACIFEDITAHKKHQQEMARSLSLLRATIESSADGLLAVDLRGRVTAFNQRFVELLRVPAELLAGGDTEAMSSFVAGQLDDPDAFLARIRDIYAQKEAESHDILRFGDGRVYERYSCPQRLGEAVVGRVWSFRDVTQRTQAEEAVRRKEEQYRTLVENISLGITLVDPSHRIVAVNATHAKATGKAPADMVGRACFQVYRGRQEPCPECPGTSAMATGRPCERMHEYQGRDGSSRTARIQAFPLAGTDGPSRGFINVFEDITQRRQLEAQYRQAQKMEAVGRLAAGVAHDFNNQLTVIQGYCEMLADHRIPSEGLGEALLQIRQAAARAQSTTSHLLSFSRRQMLRPEVVDLGRLLQEMHDPVSRMIGEDIRLTLRLGAGVSAVLVDATEMHQAIMNLVVNARDAMPSGGELTLSLSQVGISDAQAAQCHGGRSGLWVLLEVTDTGAGMEQATLDRVYDPFFTTKEVGKGTGLGVPMVQGFVAQSGGFMSFRSQVGNGTTAGLFLPPTAEAAGAAQATAPSPPEARSTARIMVVEDEDGVRRFVARALRQYGYQVIEASGPGEALTLASSQPQEIDLLVTDVIMPETNGYKLSEQLKVRWKSLRTLFMTGYSDQEPARDAAILQKPFSLDRLIESVRDALG